MHKWLRSPFTIALFGLMAEFGHGAEQLRRLTVDAGDAVASIRSYQGVSGLPCCAPPGTVDFGSAPKEGPDLRQRWKDAHVDIVRSYIWQARLDTVNNPGSLFPNWDADPTSESSYNFEYVDRVVRATRDVGADIVFTITSAIPVNTKPPSNMGRWAEVVRHLAMHFDQGWCKGFNGAVRYWEIGDDPDVNVLHFSGTPLQYYAMYEAAVRAIKSVNPALLVGGPGLGFPLNEHAPYREGFLQAIKERSLPLDFFSWQWYADGTEDPYDMVFVSQTLKEILIQFGFANTMQFAPDWNFYANPSKTPDQLVKAVYQSATLTYLQDSALSRAMVYRGDAAVGPSEKPDLEKTTRMFNADGSFMKSAAAFTAAGAMLETPERLRVSGDDRNGFAVLAGRNISHDCVQVLVTNYAINPKLLEPTDRTQLEYDIPIANTPMHISIRQPPRRTDAAAKNNRGYDLAVMRLPWSSNSRYRIERYRIDSAYDLTLVDSYDGRGNRAHVSAQLPPPSVELVVISAVLAEAHKGELTRAPLRTCKEIGSP